MNTKTLRGAAAMMMMMVVVSLWLDDAAAARIGVCMSSPLGFSSIGAVAPRNALFAPVRFAKDSYNSKDSGWNGPAGTLTVICPGTYSVSFSGNGAQFELWNQFGNKPGEAKVVATPPGGGSVSNFNTFLDGRDTLMLKSTLKGTDLASVTFSVTRISA